MRSQEPLSHLNASYLTVCPSPCSSIYPSLRRLRALARSTFLVAPSHQTQPQLQVVEAYVSNAILKTHGSDRFCVTARVHLYAIWQSTLSVTVNNANSSSERILKRLFKLEYVLIRAMAITPIGAASIALAAWSLRRVFRLLLGDCDANTMSARIKPNYFSRKVIWITGASSGIGASLAVRLAEEGALLILTARREEKLIELAESLSCPREHVHVLTLDLSADLSHIEEVAAGVPSIFGRLDYVFNNAGVSTRVAARDLSVEYVGKVLHLDFMAPVALTRAILPALREAPGGGGTIVNTVSIAAMVSTPLRSSYCAAKAALANYFRCLELEEPYIRVINAFPGSVRTPIAFSAISAGGKPFGRTDVNIEAGLDPDRVAERMLAAASSGISDPWIARPKELMAVRISRLLPGLWSVIAAKRAEGYRRTIEQS